MNGPERRAAWLRTMEQEISAGDLDEIEAASRAASPAPWVLAVTPEKWTVEQIAANHAKMALDGGPRAYFCIHPDDAAGEDARVTAMCGNGPTSEANARFVEIARVALPMLAREVRHLRRQRDDLQARNTELVEQRRAAAADAETWRKGCEIWSDNAGRIGVALIEAMRAVHVFHGPLAWYAYRDASPEMNRWRELLRRVNFAIPADLCVGAREEPPRDGAPVRCPTCGGTSWWMGGANPDGRARCVTCAPLTELPGWRTATPTDMVDWLRRYYGALLKAVADRAPADFVLSKAANVANLAMMIADVTGALAAPAASTPPTKENDRG